MKFLRALSLLLALTGTGLAEVVIKVAPDGSIHDLAAARDRVRELRRGGEIGPVKVEISAGTYFLTEPLRLGPEDSGSPTGPVTYTTTALGGGKVIVSGGRRILGWQEAEPGLWQAKLPETAWRFEQLWINGRRATVARTPNKGYFNAYSSAGADVFPDMKEPNLEAFIARPTDFAVLKAIPEAERKDVLLTIMQTWTVGACRIAALNESANAVRIVGRARYPFVQFEPDQRWYLENFRAALDEPGEWFLTADGTVLYKPLPNEKLDQINAVAPVTEKLLLLEGDVSRDQTVHDLVFKGVSFQFTQALHGPKGHHDGQAASGVGAAIECDGAQRVRFEDCEIAHTGGYAIWFRDGCSDSAIVHSHLHDLGGGGVRIGIIQMPNEKRLTHHITVDDCIIQHGGRRYPSACGVFLAHASDCVVTHNDIGDFYYSGISAGWVWGYKHSPSKRNRFDFNHIHHLGWGVLSDMGGFYGLGRAEGTTVNNNHVHHIASYRYGGWGLYTDEGSTGVTMENNLVYDTSEASFHQHYGKWNRVSNNILAYGRKAQIQRSRPEAHASFAYENNIVIYDVAKLLDGTAYNWSKGSYEMRNNVYWNSAGLPVTFLDGDLATWQAGMEGRDEGSVVADPLFVNAAQRDFRLKPESPAIKLGFKTFDHTLAGVSGSGAWRQLAAEAKYPDFEKQSQPWPQPEYVLDEGFEHLGLGVPALPRSEIRWQNKGDSIAIVEDQAASGKRSLQILDAPGLTPVWDPHLVLKPGYTQGTARVSFDLRMEPEAKFYIEWRGAGNPFKSGPHIAVQKNQMTTRQANKPIQLPEGVWTHVEMIAKLGPQADGKWTLRITPAGQPTQEVKDIPTGEGFSELQWLGFVSTAEQKVSFWLDNIRVSRAD